MRMVPVGKQDDRRRQPPPLDQTSPPAQTRNRHGCGSGYGHRPAAGTTDAAQETAPAGQDALDN